MTAEESLVALGGVVEAARRLRGLSASEVAAASGISPAYMRAIERGSNPKTQRPSRPAVEALLGIAKAVGCDPKELLRLAGYDEALADARALPARGGIDDLVRSVQESAGLLGQRGPFMAAQALDALRRLSREFRMVASGTLQCGPKEEPALTQLAVESCEQHLRAVSYQDEGWWGSAVGDRYLDNHAALRERDVEMTRIFLVNDRDLKELRGTLVRHIELGIDTYVVNPDVVDEQYWRDMVIYDDTILRVANPVTSDESDRKTARFTDDPSQVQVALMDFESLRATAIHEGGNARDVISRLKTEEGK